MEEITTSDRQLALAVDGQCVTPGHNATNITVSAVNTFTNKVLHLNIVHVKEVTSSQAMKKEGFLRCINTIQSDLNLNICVVSTDRHVSIKKLMRTDPRFKKIIHQFDPWHIGKGILKKMIKASKKKDKIIEQRYCFILVKSRSYIKRNKYELITFRIKGTCKMGPRFCQPFILVNCDMQW